MAAEFEVYQDTKGEYRWRLQANNNEIVADSNESYTTKASCLHGIEVVKCRRTDSFTRDTTNPQVRAAVPRRA